MLVKKTVVEGKEVKQIFTSPLAFLHVFFGTSPTEPKPIRRFAEESRTYRKKIVSEGRAIKWKPVTSGTEKEKLNLERMRERRKRTAW